MNDDPTSSPARIVLVGGGARSGKSRFALARARQLGARRVFFATGQALDAEMAERIAAHARTRGEDFRTVEEPLALPEALIALGGGERASDAGADVVVVDCLTLWLSNLVCRGDSEGSVAERVHALAAALARRRFHAIVVTNEVGLGIVPDNALARAYRDALGRVNAAWAQAADEAYFVVAGRTLELS